MIVPKTSSAIGRTKTTSERFLEIRLSLLDLDRSSIFLGTAKIRLSELHQKCTPDQHWEELEFFVTPSEFLRGARVVVQARREDLEQHYLQSKRKDSLTRLRNVTDWIMRFEQDGVRSWNKRFHDDMAMNGGNVTVVDGISLKNLVLIKKLYLTAFHSGKTLIIGAFIALPLWPC